ncbi:general transcription factor IIF subunit 1-like [Ischnura elegans]|uniref:general transcription factor IIF subunit 1-like n=1 Tax=Ischnura elegans TaxID=197161 RepID=UPI001ED89DA9|nr:general transcription factor IIF subunit 1-like [Ischnura elegans]
MARAKKSKKKAGAVTTTPSSTKPTSEMLDDFYLNCVQSSSAKTSTFEGKLAAIEERYKALPWAEQKAMLNFFLMKTRGVKILEYLQLALGSLITRDITYVLASAQESDPLDVEPPLRSKDECNLEDYGEFKEEQLLEIIASLVALSSENMAMNFYKSAASLLDERRREEQKSTSPRKTKEEEESEITTLLAELYKEDETTEKKEAVYDPCAQEDEPKKSKKGSKRGKGKDKKSEKKSKSKDRKHDNKKKEDKKEKKDKKQKRNKKDKKKGKGSKKGMGGANEEMNLRKKYKVPNEPEETVDWMMTLPIWASGIVLSKAITSKQDADNLAKVNEYWKYLVTCVESENEARKTIEKAISDLKQ